MDTKGICILVVNDDLTCINIVSEMLLQHCNYQVLHVGSVLDVLNAIWETKDNLDLVLTNAHKLESNGIVIVQHIQDKLKLPVILMCADKTKILSKGEPSRFAAYVLKGLSRSDVNNLWQYALKKEKDKIMAVQTNKTHASSGETALLDRKRKTTETTKEKGEGGEGGEEDHPIAKKPRVVWTKEMHQKFLEAIEMIGYEKAVPKKIVEVMGIPGLTRENVASHLQKFRGSTKRTQETGAKESITTTKSHYLQTLNNEISFGTTSGRTIYKNVGGYFPDLRNTLLETGENISSGNFVGYRLTNDGNTIEFGNSEGSNNKQDISIQPTAEKTGNYFSVQNLEAFSEIAQSFDDFLDEAMIEETGNKCCPLDWEGFDDALFEH